MRTQSTDTTLKAERFLIELIRGKTIQERLQSMISLSSMTMQLAKRAIERANPQANRHELNLLFIKYHYGEDLYKKVKLFLFKNPNEQK